VVAGAGLAGFFRHRRADFHPASNPAHDTRFVQHHFSDRTLSVFDNGENDAVASRGRHDVPARLGGGCHRLLQQDVITLVRDQLFNPVDVHFGLRVSLTSTWRKYAISFAELSQDGWGFQAKDFDSASLYGVLFQIPVDASFGLWIDDVMLAQQP